MKPANCFVDAEGNVRIGDFGLSISTLTRDETHLTSTGSFLGTPAFASPEQLKGEALGVQSDVYSVGATLYYLLTGQPPFDAPNVMALVAKIAQESPRSPRDLSRIIPPGLAPVIHPKCGLQDRIAGTYLVPR